MDGFVSYCDMIYHMQDTLDWSNPCQVRMEAKIQLVVKDKLNDRWRQYKAELKKVWYTPNAGLPARFQCGDGYVNHDQWRLLVWMAR